VSKVKIRMVMMFMERRIGFYGIRSLYYIHLGYVGIWAHEKCYGNLHELVDNGEESDEVPKIENKIPNIDKSGVWFKNWESFI
jgi:hypothetical protein